VRRLIAFAWAAAVACAASATWAEAVQPAPECGPHSEPFPCSERLREFERTGAFADLDASLRALLLQDRFYQDNYDTADLVHGILMEVALVATLPREGRILPAWKSARPTSPFVTMAEAMALMQQGRKAIVDAGAHAPPEAFELLRLKFGQAARLLATVPQEMRETAVWQSLQLAIAAELDVKNAKSMLRRVSRRWPRHVDFYTTMLTRLKSAAGGTWAAVSEVVELGTSRTASTDGLAFYAKLYDFLAYESGAESAADWSRMQAGFKDWIARDPGSYPKNRYASHACRQRDKRAFSAAMDLLDKDSIATEAWLPGHSYEACIAWATRPA
jgi:hypothetical protein